MVDKEKNKFGSASDFKKTTYSDLVGEYEDLNVDLEYAEQSYLSSLSAYESAVSTSLKQSRYLAAYINPTTPEISKYPNVMMFMSIVFTLCFLCWSIAVLLFFSIRDRR